MDQSIFKRVLTLILTFYELARSKAKKYTDAAIAALPNGLVYKGAVDYYSDLPGADQTVGDCYTVRYKGTSGTVPDGTEYAWGPVGGVNQWVPVGPDISGKIDRVDGATAGNLPKLKADGSLEDSGKAYPTVSIVKETTLKINL